MRVNPPRHVVLIPSYNTGARLFDTIAGVRALAWPVIVIIDGSTDRTDETLLQMSQRDPGLSACVQMKNEGKGAAVLRGLQLAHTQGFTHALTMDADGQHSTAHVREMIALSLAHPEAMILGVPLFDASAPYIRILGHKLANFCTALLTKKEAIADSLFGFRVYPIPPLIAIFESTTGMRRFDFDSEAAIRLHWRGVRAINIATPVRYFCRAEGGVSHFKYVRDNLRLARMYARLAGNRLTSRSFRSFLR
jgi:glycosyltransferase involved in cell wall biosynthesis